MLRAFSNPLEHLVTIGSSLLLPYHDFSALVADKFGVLSHVPSHVFIFLAEWRGIKEHVTYFITLMITFISITLRFVCKVISRSQAGRQQPVKRVG